MSIPARKGYRKGENGRVMSTNMNDASNESLIQALHDAAADLSYYNAAEGQVYFMEAGARGVARNRWNSLVNEAIARGIYNKEDFSGYLV